MKRRVLLLSVFVLNLAGGLALTAPPASAHGSTAHRMSVTGSLKIHDDEPIGSEECNRTVSLFDDAQLPAKPEAFIWKWWGCGGEIRFVLHVSAILASDGRFDVTVKFYLYEGTSEDTIDLDGSASTSTTMGLGSKALNSIVRNTAEGGDWVSFNLNFTNSHV